MLLAWLDCRARGGQLIFRMEDLDPARSRTEYALAIADDLRWLGLDWDEGYPEASYCQSSRSGFYQDAFDTLRRRDLVYPCYCSRAERLAAAAPHPGEQHVDPGCRCAYFDENDRKAMEALGRRPAWKIRVPDRTISFVDEHYGPRQQDLLRDGDFILRRSDGVFAYQLAVTVDDALMGVDRVVRGRDLLDSTARQAWLMELWGAPIPAYAHGPLILMDRRKMSKRLGDLSVSELRKHHRPEALLGEMAHRLKLTETNEAISARELIPLFSWDKIPLEDIPYGAH